jgi:hypothetical protein
MGKILFILVCFLAMLLIQNTNKCHILLGEAIFVKAEI